MAMTTKLIPQFKHQAPDGMHYEVNEFKQNVFSIWLHYDREFDYNLGKPVRCIWGFYNFKKCQFYAPVNSSTIGKPVEYQNTRDYTAMPLKQTVLESCFV
jgi:hypothetical protein